MMEITSAPTFNRFFLGRFPCLPLLKSIKLVFYNPANKQNNLIQNLLGSSGEWNQQSRIKTLGYDSRFFQTLDFRISCQETVVYDVHFELFRLIYPTLWRCYVQFHNDCTLDSSMCVYSSIHFLPLIPLLVPQMPVFALKEEAGVPMKTQGEHAISMCVFVF